MKRRKMAKIAFLATMLVFLGLFNHAAGFAPIMRVIAGSSSIEPDTPHGNFDQLPMFTGTATHRYELQIPPGTNGMAPKLALVYRSTNGNGWFGVGWEMEGLAYIERDATKRVPRYDNSDGYILNMDGLTYELVRAQSNTNGIGYYHTKCETWLRINYNGSYWIVNTKDGRELRFGYNNDARVPIVGHSTLIRTWVVDRVKDTCGNYMSYTYYLDANSGEYYPSSIKYTENTNYGLTKLRIVTFARENRTDNVQPAAKWMLSRIKEIKITIDGAQVERYLLSYRYSKCSNHSLLASVSRYGSGGVAETTVMTYASDSGSLTWTLKPGATYPPHDHWDDNACGDLDWDGLIDHLEYYFDSSTYDYKLKYYWMNKGDGTFERKYAANLSFGGSPRMVDIDGNGKEDFYSGGWRGGIPYVNNWGGMPEWIHDSAWQYSGGYTNSAYADFNNDAVVDEMLVTGGIIYLSSPSAKGFTRRQDYLDIPAPYSLSTTNCALVDLNGDWWPDLSFGKDTLINNTAGIWVNDSVWDIPTLNAVLGSAWIDHNGDGLSDFTYQNANAYINNTHGWTPRSEWAPLAPGQHFTSDINGDGIPDINEGIEYYLRLPNGTISSADLGIPDPYGEDWAYINDDPFPDIVDGVTREFYLSNAKPDLLINVKQPTGGTTSWEYRRIPVFPYLDTGLRRGLTTRIYAIARIIENEATGRTGAELITSFTYPEGQFNRDKRFFMGFPWVKIVYPNKEYSLTTFSQKIASAGRIESTKYYSATNQLLYEEKDNWVFADIDGSPNGYAIILDSAERKWYGTEPKQTKTTYAYDEYGNVITEANSGDIAIAGDEYTVTRGYINLNDSQHYLIGRLNRENVSDAANEILQDKLFWYDSLPYGQATKGLLTEEKSWLDRFNGAPTCSAEAFAAANAGRPNQDQLDPHPLVTYTYDAFGNRISTTKHNVRPDGTWEDQIGRAHV